MYMYQSEYLSGALTDSQDVSLAVPYHSVEEPFMIIVPIRITGRWLSVHGWGGRDTFVYTHPLPVAHASATVV